ncbi:MAG: GWxTD domain-containing protein [Ignavibacteriae bacterium]|nr:GWxTD domain-containing protein [Ignavibacteriota bacterium]
MRMSRFALCFFILLWIPLTLPAQILKGKGVFQFGVDLARFYGDSTQNYIEMYYGIRENILTYKPDSAGLTGAANMKLEVRRETVVVAKKEWTVPHVVTDTSRLAMGQQMVGIEAVALPAGDYVITLSGYDVNDVSRTDSLSFPLAVRSFPADTEELSDVEFCTSIQQSANKQSVFYKNTLEVIPNASKLYGAGLPIVYYYVEVYNLMRNTVEQNATVHTAVIDASGKEVVSHDKTKSRTHNSSVEVGTMNVSALRSGTYLFRLSLMDAEKNVLATAGKKFFIYKPGSIPDTTEQLAAAQFSLTDYASMTDSAVSLEFAQAKYIATDAEQLQFEKLTDLKAKQLFLAEFWKRRDPEPGTPVNEFKEQYIQRVEYANKNLTIGFRQGWKTDRGRIYILYGPYDEVERFPSSSESLPYEIWHYNSLQGGAIFVFVDRTGMGEYALVHSTHRNELHDENWYQQYAQKMR